MFKKDSMAVLAHPMHLRLRLRWVEVRCLARTLPFCIFLCALPACDDRRQIQEDSWSDYISGGRFNTDSPSISPDGHSLVYASPCTGKGDIYITRGQRSDPVRLTTSMSFESYPRFIGSRKIAFAREQGGRRHLWTMNTDGSQQQQLTRGNVRDNLRDVSRDGHYVHFSRAIPSSSMGLLSHAYILPLRNLAAGPLAAGDIAAMSDDGKSVVFSEDGRLWKIDLTNDAITRTELKASGLPIDVSGNGNLVLLARAPLGKATGEHDYFVWDMRKNREWRIGRGHSAMFLGRKGHHVLVLVGYDQIPFVAAAHGGERRQLTCPAGYKAQPLPLPSEAGAIVGIFSKSDRSIRKAVFIAPDSQKATVFASFECDEVSFVRSRIFGEDGAESSSPPRE